MAAVDPHQFLVLQLPGHVRGRRVAVAGIALQRAEENLLELGRDLRVQLTRRRRIDQQTLVHHRQRIRPRERRLAGEHLIEHRAQRVDVAALVAALALHLLGRDVVGRAQRRREPHLRDAPRILLQCDAEVDDLDAVAVAHHDVLRLQVAVHHAVLVQIVEGVANGQRERDRALDGQLALLVEDRSFRIVRSSLPSTHSMTM